MIVVVLQTAGAALLQNLLGRYNVRGAGKTKHNPANRPTNRSLGRMEQGYKAVAKDQNVNAADFDLQLNTPPSDLNVGDSLLPYASNGINADTGNYLVQANPYADEVHFAHELGHVVSRQTPVGGAVRNVRDMIARNPKLAATLTATSLGAPLVMSAMEEGDDDLDTAVLAALATAAPTLVDETAATINATGIMNKAGKRGMDGSQARRLAGGYASYIAPLILAASAGNLIGNQLD
jgi:hypothetical protein